jgi:membrane protease YdiL (CAAX protease family)
VLEEPTMEDDHLQEPENERPGREVIVMLAVFFEAGLAPLSLLLGWLFGHPPLEHFIWSAQDALVGVMATVPLVAMFLAMLRWPIGPLAKVKDFCDYEVIPLLGKSSWSEIALVSFAAGVGEEMLFRGVVQPTIGGWLGFPLGLLLASLLFGLVHPISLTYMIIASILGLYLGLVLFLGGNLISVIVIHALYDFAALGYLLRIRPDLESEET